MSVLESKIEAAVIKYCLENKIRCEKLVRFSLTGWPDRTLFYKGHIMLLELKQKGKKPTAIQALVLDQLSREGFRAMWADSAEEAIHDIKLWRDYVNSRTSN